VTNGITFADHNVAPCLPMILSRVDERSVHIPEDCSIHVYLGPIEIRARIFPPIDVPELFAILPRRRVFGIVARRPWLRRKRV
jgi:hypothetical protein